MKPGGTEQATATLKRIKEVFADAGGGSVMKATAADRLIEQMDGRHFERIVEIGTYRGVSAAVFSCFAETVITIDIAAQGYTGAVLSVAGVLGRVIPLIVPYDPARARLIAALDFDMAFIDGNHRPPHPELDFNMVKKCGTVLFHDYPQSGSGPAGNGAGVLLDEHTPEGKIDRCPPFAWWSAD